MKDFLIFLIHIYQKGISPILPPRCRFYPSCSRYAETVIREKGVVHGLWRTLLRLLRCHPFTDGGVDLP